MDTRGKFYGHSLFVDDCTGRLSFRDMSGPTPDATDDGVLWLDDSRPIRISMQHEWSASVPVVDEAGDKFHIGMAARDVADMLDFLSRWVPAGGLHEEDMHAATSPKLRVVFTQDAAAGVKVLATLLAHAVCQSGDASAT